MNLEIGKLYTCSKNYNLLVYPTEEIATLGAVASGKWGGPSAASWWSMELKCHVSFIPGARIFCVLKIGRRAPGDDCCYPVLVVAGENVGWILTADWLNIKEMTA